MSGVFPPGGRQGESVEITISGTDLDSVDRLMFSHPGIVARPKLRDPAEFETAPQPVPNQFQIAVGADVPPGIYELRAVGKYGVSNPRAFAVGNLTEALEAEPNETPASAQEVALDAVVNGRSNRGGDLDHYRFAAKAGQRVLIECRARPLDSRLDAALAVYDAAGRELAREYDGSLHDTLVDFTVPADGAYTVKVHDFIYGGGDEYAYRLSLSTLPRVDFAFPPAGLPGSKANYQLYGRNLPGGKPAPGMTIDGKPLEVVTAAIELPAGAAAAQLPAETLIEPAEAGIDAAPYRLPTPRGMAEPVLIGFASAPIVVEQEPNDAPEKAQKLPLPCECAGQFYPQGDQDWFLFDAKQGEKYVIEVISQRQGSIADPFLLVEQITVDKQGKEQAKELKSEDDAGETAADPDFNTRHDDPIYRFTAPADGVYRVLVRDLYFGSRGDPRFVYRLAIRPEQPDFRLVALPKFSGSQANANQQPSIVWNPLLRKGGAELIEIVAVRRDGFDGEIIVTAEDLPPGVGAAPASIGPGGNSAALVLKASDDAPAAAAPFRLVGRAKIGDKQIEREARPAALVWAGQQRQMAARSRLSHALALAVSDVERAPFSVEAKDGAAWEMSRAGKLEIPLSITRRDGFAGPIQMTVSGLPRGFQRVNNLAVGDKADTAKLSLTIPANAPLGSFSIYLRATAKHSYRRNPEAAAAAAERQKELGQLATELAAAAKTATEAKKAAEKNEAETERLAEKS
ncbi:MAG TPA: PPC domain-containing protein, partial [Pirellulales bacterium]|nr:PPC domain-containing protein [Pirellulales bacterium]